MRYKEILALVLIIWLSFLPLSDTVEAAAGDLDPSFGNGGKVVTDFGSIDRAFEVGIQADGKIVAAGSTTVLSPFDDFALARYNTDGSLDTAFGAGGKVITLSHRAADRNLRASVNTCLGRGDAIVSLFSPGLFGFTGIDDSNTADNTCACL